MEATLTSLTLALGIVFLIIGLFGRMFPPGYKNQFYGYRLSSARRNADTWAVANKYSATVMLIEGIVLTAIGLLSLLFLDSGRIGKVVAAGLLITSILIVAIGTEKHLNKLFDKDGNRKTITTLK